MKADIKGALEQIDKSYKAFEHNGIKKTKEEVTAVLKYGLEMGYTNTGQFTTNEVDHVLSAFKNEKP